MAVAPAADAFVLAGHGRRIAAALLDGVLGSVVVGAFAAVGFGVGAFGARGSSSDGFDALGWLLLGTAAGFALGVALWVALVIWLVRRPGRHNGQTAGKQMLGIRAARADRSEIGLGWGLLREVVAKGLLLGMTSSVISALLGFIDGGTIGALVAVGIWYGPALADEQHRALHDRLCDTRVVVVDAPAPPAPPAPPADDQPLARPHVGMRR